MTSSPQEEPSLQDVLDALVREFESAGILEARVDAELLACHVLNISRGELAARLVRGDSFGHELIGRIEALGRRRAAREPLQHITGHAYFRNLDLRVGPGVFVPRPETELLAQIVIDHVRVLPDPEPWVVDMGTGSGALALAIATEVPHARVFAVEKSPEALVWTRANLASIAASNLTLVEADLADALQEHPEKFAVVVSNPPYIPNNALPRDPEVRLFDPDIALYGGDDGLDVIRNLIETAARLLRPGGLLALEHGEEQGAAVLALLAAEPWRAGATHPDLLGRTRYTTALR